MLCDSSHANGSKREDTDVNLPILRRAPLGRAFEPNLKVFLVPSKIRSMSQPSLLRILLRAAATSLVAVVAALGVVSVERAVIGVPLTGLDLAEILIVPIVVSFPIAAFIFTQAEKLRAAYEKLAALNREVEQAHRERDQANEAVDYAASHDPTTGLLNRAHFLRELTRAYQRGEGDVLLIADVDNFQRINDTHGHLKGDEALVLIASALTDTSRPGDLLGRLGSEEFGVLLKSITVASAADLAEVIQRKVRQISWFPTEQQTELLSVSIGGAALRDHQAGVVEVLTHAGRSLVKAKRSGLPSIAFYHMLSEVARGMAEAKDREDRRSKEQPTR